jgi:hypothetical protein
MAISAERAFGQSEKSPQSLICRSGVAVEARTGIGGESYPGGSRARNGALRAKGRATSAEQLNPTSVAGSRTARTASSGATLEIGDGSPHLEAAVGAGATGAL